MRVNGGTVINDMTLNTHTHTHTSHITTRVNTTTHLQKSSPVFLAHKHMSAICSNEVLIVNHFNSGQKHWIQ